MLRGFISSRIRSSMYNNITGLRVGIYEDVFRSDYMKFWVFREPVENCAHIQKCRIKVPLWRLISLRDRFRNRHFCPNESVDLRIENLFCDGSIRVFEEFNGKSGKIIIPISLLINSVCCVYWASHSQRIYLM